MNTSHRVPGRRASVDYRVLAGAVVFTVLACSPLAFGERQSACCGPISPDGRQLLVFLDSLPVEQHWPAGWHVNWRTGESEHQSDKPSSHCSAFAASAADRLGIYLLRIHRVLLANAQFDWLQSRGAAEKGWRRLRGYREAQEVANQGQLVVASRSQSEFRKAWAHRNPPSHWEKPS